MVYWTFEPEVTFSWLSSKIGTEVGVFVGLDFNTENTTTNYTSGDILHIDFTVAQHLPFLSGLIGVGANGYWYRQLTGDSGSGALLGPFEAEQVGIGPVVSYIRQIGKSTLAIDVKWLPQIDGVRPELLIDVQRHHGMNFPNRVFLWFSSSV